MNKEKLVQEVSDVLNQMEKVTFPVCHVSESIIKPIQNKLDNVRFLKKI